MVYEASIAQFLQEAKQHLQVALKETKTVTFVIGNESADVDSICGAVAYAYKRTYASNPPIFHVPVTNIYHWDLALRTELAPVFEKAKIQYEDLITLSDLPEPSEYHKKLPATSTRWILVDHNALTGHLAKYYSGSVVGVIDHHQEEHKVPKGHSKEPRVIEKCGSCTSLIVRECHRFDTKPAPAEHGKPAQSPKPAEHTKPAPAEHTKPAPVDHTKPVPLPTPVTKPAPVQCEFAWLALGAILIDTQALTAVHKVTEYDITAVEWLETTLKYGGVAYDRKKFFEEIQKAKENIAHLEMYDILRKDFKKWDETANSGYKMVIGISSIVKSLSFLIERAGGAKKFKEEIEKYSVERDLSIFCIMTSYTSKGGEYCRELFVIARDKAGTEALKRFESKHAKELDLTKGDFGLDAEGDKHKGYCRAWRQKATECGRKQVGPYLRLSALERVEKH